MTWYRCGGGGGLKESDIAFESNYISKDSSYKTATFEDISDYQIVIFSFNDNGTDCLDRLIITPNNASEIFNGSSKSFSVTLTSNFTLTVTSTTMTTTYYSGNWREVTVSAVGIK